jgi:transcriptional regulator with XRE-family HTH domain
MATELPLTPELPKAGLRDLGQAIRQMRLARKVTVQELSVQLGMSRNFIFKLERGEWGDIGLLKFLQITLGLGLKPDRMLMEGGLIPKTDPGRAPDPVDYLSDNYHLSPENIRQALDFLEFLRRREHPGAKESS